MTADEIKARALEEAAEIRSKAEAEARKVRAKVKPVVRRLEAIRYDPPAVGWKSTAVLFLIMCLLAGAFYYAGKRVERSWWRTQIAAKSAAAQQVLTQLGHEAPDLDAALIREFSNEIAQLRDAERRLADAKNRADADNLRLRRELADKPGAPLPPADVCRSLPAHCLRN